MRISLGYDRHRLFADPDGIVRLGGVSVRAGYGIVAHSDGDAVYHALTDSIASAWLGKTVGELFEDTDERWKGHDSSRFLEEAFALAGRPGIENADVIVVSDQIIIRGIADEMRRNISRILRIDGEKVSVKGRRREGDGSDTAVECLCAILFS